MLKIKVSIKKPARSPLKTGSNKKKLEKMVNGTKSQFMTLQSKVMKMVGK